MRLAGLQGSSHEEMQCVLGQGSHPRRGAEVLSAELSQL